MVSNGADAPPLRDHVPLVLKRHGLDPTTADVARAWLNHLLGAIVLTADRAAFVRPLEKAGRVGVSLAGVAELALDDLVERTAVVAERIAGRLVSN